MKRLGVCLLLALCSAVAFAQGSPTITHRVLLPIYLDQPVHGAFNSLWTTQLSMMNTGTTGTATIETCGNSICLAFAQANQLLDPGETQHVLPEFTPLPSGAIPGRVLTIYFNGTDFFDQLAFNLRVADTSRSTQSAGTEVPVVRDRDFRTATTRLLNVPVDPNFRLTFRLYSLNVGAFDYAIRVYNEGTGTLLGSQNVHITTPEWGNGHRLVLDPGYFDSDVASLISSASLPPAVRIEVEPLTTGAQFWTFVSITNNTTQEFTLVTPQ